jgi:hypothetical protein
MFAVGLPAGPQRTPRAGWPELLAEPQGMPAICAPGPSARVAIDIGGPKFKGFQPISKDFKGFQSKNPAV